VARAGGAAEVFTQDHDALGVPPGDGAALALALEALLRDPERRRRLADQARQTALERFNRDRLGPQVLEAYAALRGHQGVMKVPLMLARDERTNW
jgi:glycosyltransferase involved in cell wall biosynthesis